MEESDTQFDPVKRRVKRSWYGDGRRKSWRQRQREGFEGKNE